MRKLMLLSACLVACAAVAVADDKDKKEDKTKSEPTVTATTLSVTRKLDQKMFAFAYSDSTNVTLLVRYPGKQLLGVDQSSELKSLKDDKGNSLIDEKGFFKVNFSPYPTIAKDRSAMLVYVNAYNKVPAKGATRLTIKGDLMVVCGTGEKSEEIKKFEFKDKEEAKAGDFKLKVTQEKTFNTQGATVALTSPTKDLKGLVIKDADGKEVEVYGGGTPFSNNPKEFTFNYTLLKPLKEGKVTISYFTKSEKVKVPVDLDVSVGLGD